MRDSIYSYSVSFEFYMFENMLDPKEFSRIDYGEKLRILHHIIDPIKDTHEVYQKAYKIITKPNLQEKVLERLYEIIRSAYLRYIHKKEEEKSVNEMKVLENIKKTIEELHKKEQQEDDTKDLDKILMDQIENLEKEQLT